MPMQKPLLSAGGLRCPARVFVTVRDDRDIDITSRAAPVVQEICAMADSVGTTSTRDVWDLLVLRQCSFALAKDVELFSYPGLSRN